MSEIISRIGFVVIFLVFIVIGTAGAIQAPRQLLAVLRDGRMQSNGQNIAFRNRPIAFVLAMAAGCLVWGAFAAMAMLGIWMIGSAVLTWAMQTDVLSFWLSRVALPPRAAYDWSRRCYTVGARR